MRERCRVWASASDSFIDRSRFAPAEREQRAILKKRNETEKICKSGRKKNGIANYAINFLKNEEKNRQKITLINNGKSDQNSKFGMTSYPKAPPRNFLIRMPPMK